MNKDFIIEIKTKWEPLNNTYTRKIISYELNKSRDFKDESIYNRLLELYSLSEETVDYIEDNKLEIDVIDKETGKSIEKRSALMNMLVKFSKYRFEIEEQ